MVVATLEATLVLREEELLSRVTSDRAMRVQEAMAIMKVVGDMVLRPAALEVMVVLATMVMEKAIVVALLTTVVEVTIAIALIAEVKTLEAIADPLKELPKILGAIVDPLVEVEASIEEGDKEVDMIAQGARLEMQGTITKIK